MPALGEYYFLFGNTFGVVTKVDLPTGNSTLMTFGPGANESVLVDSTLLTPSFLLTFGPPPPGSPLVPGALVFWVPDYTGRITVDQLPENLNPLTTTWIIVIWTTDGFENLAWIQDMSTGAAIIAHSSELFFIQAIT